MNIYGLDYNVDFTLGYMCHNYIAGLFYLCPPSKHFGIQSHCERCLLATSKVFRHIAEQHWQFACKRNLKWLS